MGTSTQCDSDQTGESPDSVYKQVLKNEVEMRTITKADTTNTEEVLDGLWSFVVGISSFLAQVMLGGYVYTGGIFYTLFIDEFQEMGVVAVSWLCNMPITLWFLGSPVGSLLTNKLGPRLCSSIGGCLACLGLSLCYFTTNFYVLFLSYGIIAGFGHGIMYVGFITSVSRYFKRYRAMVTILTTLGPISGMAIYSFLVQFLIESFHWQGSLLILGGIAFNICACAAVLFPVKSTASDRKTSFVSLLKLKPFMLFEFSCVFINLASSLMFLHLPSLVISYGLGSKMASITLTVFSISNAAAKIICSIVGQFVPADPVYVYSGFLTVYSIAVVLLPVIESTAWLLIVDVVMAFCFNVCGGHTMEVILNLTGPEHFPSGVGLTQFFKSIGVLIAGPFAGVLFKLSGSYQTSFYVGGCISLVNIAILLPVIVQRCRGHVTKSDVISRELSVQEETTKWLE